MCAGDSERVCLAEGKADMFAVLESQGSCAVKLLQNKQESTTVPARPHTVQSGTVSPVRERCEELRADIGSCYDRTLYSTGHLRGHSHGDPDFDSLWRYVPVSSCVCRSRPCDCLIPTPSEQSYQLSVRFTVISLVPR
jgi:hypothetical protein